jgi:hypothetical protein
MLVDLLVRLATTRPDIRRECLAYLKKHAAPSPGEQKQTEGERLLALWAEIAPDLDELDDYGGGDYRMADQVASLLYQIEQAFSQNKKLEAGYRHQVLVNALPYIESGNAGLDDQLYDLAYATCYDDKDLRSQAEAFEAMGGDWKIDHARRIYRKLGDRDRYLELGKRKMVHGGDFYDLASFYRKSGEKKLAMQVAEDGLRKGQGRMDELRQFVAQRAKDAGNRDRYLQLQFAQTVDYLTCDKYKSLRRLCMAAE